MWLALHYSMTSTSIDTLRQQLYKCRLTTVPIVKLREGAIKFTLGENIAVVASPVVVADLVSSKHI